MTSLRASIDELNDTTADIKSHFSNGFRLEIREHITEEVNNVMQQSVETYEERHALDEKLCSCMELLIEEVRSFKKVGFWFKAIAAFVGSVAVITAAIAAIISKMN